VQTINEILSKTVLKPYATGMCKQIIDTISAIATAPGEGGIGIVRVSGPKSMAIADSLFSCSGPPPSQRPANSFVHGYVRAQSDHASDIDEAILLIYRAPASYTAEDVVEFQCHGGTTAVQRVLRCVLDQGARLAEPGEFTKRAFLNGRIDLLQAEAVMDIIKARSERAAAVAVEQLEGRLSKPFNAIYDHILDLSASIEATLDFSEDELPRQLFIDIGKKLDEERENLTRLLESWDEGRLLREGVRVVIAGKPNVGKSTLLNTLVGHNRAIVTNTAGTTRDTIEEYISLFGYPVKLIDTAGIRDSECEIEQQGIARARNLIENADLTVWIIDISQQFDKKELVDIEEVADIILLNKADLAHEIPPIIGPDVVTIVASLVSNDGVDALKREIARQLGFVQDTAAHTTISERHRIIVQQTLNELNHADRLLSTDDPEHAVFIADHLRDALDYLGTVTGRTYSESLLDTIFSRFCVGK
jgi:tRNA modification GTPase